MCDDGGVKGEKGIEVKKKQVGLKTFGNSIKGGKRERKKERKKGR